MASNAVKIKKYIPVQSVLLAVIIALSLTARVSAAGVAITGGTNGADCNSGGYFTPGSVTVQSGDTVTFSVPANDPYAGGLEVHGFPQGDFVVARGASVTTQPLTGSSVSYYGTWPSSGCMKGSGTITVSAPAPPASGGPVVPSSPSGGSGTPAPTAKNTPGPASPPPAGSISNQTSPTADTPTSTKAGPAKSNSTHKTTTVATAQAPMSKNAAFVGGGAAVLLAAAAFFGRRLVLRRRVTVPAVQPSVLQPSDTPPQQDMHDQEHNQL